MAKLTKRAKAARAKFARQAKAGTGKVGKAAAKPRTSQAEALSAWRNDAPVNATGKAGSRPLAARAPSG